ncbi:glycosyltransferase [Paenibacillus alvei]|uniref:glycosyltransferase n=1 Tax=Paenibacillus alvei TaxID=44250 RepID=UPI00227DC110|nr:glycosyltransferase [Paenibacillus alvei]
MNTVLIISPTPIGKQMAGPSIRYWEIACQLSVDNRVILLAPKNIDLSNDRLLLDILNVKNLIKYTSMSDLIVIQGMTLWKYPFIKFFSKPIAIDLYDPMHLENLEIYTEDKFMNRLLYRTTKKMICEQLAKGDYFFCASEKQKDYWLGMLTAVGRINVHEYNKINRDINKLIGIVPFGIPDIAPIKEANLIRDKFPQIGKNDKIVIWGGGIWGWLDPETLISAMKIVKVKRSDIKCLFMGVNPPNAKASHKLQKLVKMIKDLDLEDTVILNDWVDYDERSKFLLEASVGVSLHDNHLETRFSYRTRILDYIWCGLPILSSNGDVFADIIEREQLGVIVPVKDINATADAILKLVDNRKISIQKEEYMWSFITKDLKEYTQNPYFTSPRVSLFGEFKWFFWRMVYYSIRIIDKSKALIKK